MSERRTLVSERLQNVVVLEKKNRWRKTWPRYMVKLYSLSDIEGHVKAQLKRVKLCAREQVPYELKAYCYDEAGKPGSSKQVAEYWAGVWKHFGFTHIEMLLTSTVVVKATVVQLAEIAARLPLTPFELVFAEK